MLRRLSSTFVRGRTGKRVLSHLTSKRTLARHFSADNKTDRNGHENKSDKTDDNTTAKNGHFPAIARHSSDDNTTDKNGHKNKSERNMFVSFGNPLLDIVSAVSAAEEDALVRRFGLLRDVGQEVETQGILHEIRHKKKTLSPGGCALNTCRALRWLDSDDGRVEVVFVGSVGRDQNRVELEDFLHRDGIKTKFSVHPTLPTGHCVALVRGMERTMCANVGAADEFSVADFDRMALAETVRRAKVVYLTSFFAKHSWDVVDRISRLRASPTSPSDDGEMRGNFALAFNLNGEYVFQDPKFVVQVVALLPRVDVLFGNRNEFAAFVSSSRRLGYKSPILNGIMRLFQRLEEGMEETELIDDAAEAEGCEVRSRTTVVVTDGPKPVMTFRVEVVGDPGKSVVLGFRSVESPPVPASQIADTIGAGDSFVAGYAQRLMRQMDEGRNVVGFEERTQCVQRGIYTSQEMIRQTGTHLPTHPPTPMD